MLKGIYLTLMMGPAVAVPVPKAVADALTAVQVTTSSGARSGFQLTFTLAKDSPLATTLIPAGFFDPLIRVIIIVTVVGLPNVIMDGVITQQQVVASNQAGQSTLTVTGEDVSRAMDLIDFTGFPWPAMPAEARVALMVAKYAVFGIIPAVIPSVLIDVPNPLEIIPKQQGTDFAYINQLADDVGYVFYIEPGPAPGVNVRVLGARGEGRRAAARAQRQYGCRDQRRLAQLHAGRDVEDALHPLHPEPFDESADPDSDSRYHAAQPTAWGKAARSAPGQVHPRQGERKGQRWAGKVHTSPGCVDRLGQSREVSGCHLGFGFTQRLALRTRAKGAFPSWGCVARDWRTTASITSRA